MTLIDDIKRKIRSPYKLELLIIVILTFTIFFAIIDLLMNIISQLPILDAKIQIERLGVLFFIITYIIAPFILSIIIAIFYYQWAYAEDVRTSKRVFKIIQLTLFLVVILIFINAYKTNKKTKVFIYSEYKIVKFEYREDSKLKMKTSSIESMGDNYYSVKDYITFGRYFIVIDYLTNEEPLELQKYPIVETFKNTCDTIPMPSADL